MRSRRTEEQERKHNREKKIPKQNAKKTQTWKAKMQNILTTRPTELRRSMMKKPNCHVMKDNHKMQMLRRTQGGHGQRNI